jgi:hypothetical protein
MKRDISIFGRIGWLQSCQKEINDTKAPKLADMPRGLLKAPTYILVRVRAVPIGKDTDTRPEVQWQHVPCISGDSLRNILR